MADVLCVCGDPGPAAAVAPVAACLQQRGHAIRGLSSAAAVASFAEFGFTTMTVPDPFAAAAVERLGDADVILAGSSWGERSELPVIACGQRTHLKSLVVLDFWSHYRERFTLPDGSRVFPSRVAVMDQRARAGMLAAGCPADRLVVTGAPQFDRLVDPATQESARRAIDAVRAAAGAGPDTAFVLFISQPIEMQVGRQFGYTESEVLIAALDALDRIGAAKGRTIAVGIRRHALERSAVPLPAYRRLHVVELPSSLDKMACLLAADLVVGMNSVMLIEAALLGRQVLSLQPGLATPDALWTNETGATTPVYDRESIDAAVAAALNRAPGIPITGLGDVGRGGAARRAADEVERLLTEES
jgi:hypothetical protein